MYTYGPHYFSKSSIISSFLSHFCSKLFISLLSNHPLCPLNHHSLSRVAIDAGIRHSWRAIAASHVIVRHIRQWRHLIASFVSAIRRQVTIERYATIIRNCHGRQEMRATCVVPLPIKLTRYFSSLSAGFRKSSTWNQLSFNYIVYNYSSIRDAVMVLPLGSFVCFSCLPSCMFL